MLSLISAISLLLVASNIASAGGNSNDLIAHYSFRTNANAPFTNGVLYINGRYEPNGHFAHYLRYVGTDIIKDLRYDSFSVSLDFYPLPRKRGMSSLSTLEQKLELWTRGRYSRWCGFDPNVFRTDNILTGGYNHRWFGINREDGFLHITLNNQAFVHPFRNVPVKPGRWHNIVCSVDLRRGQIFTLFDGRALEPINLPSDFKAEVLGSDEEATDREFTFANYSNGSVFYGFAANLKIFGGALSQTEMAALYSASATERPRLPGGSFPWAGTILALAAIFLVSVLLRLRMKRAAWRRRRVMELETSPSKADS